MAKETPKNISSAEKSLLEPEGFETRAEKLATAVYMITEHLSPNEPLRQKLRIKAANFITGVRFLPSVHPDDMPSLTGDIAGDIKEVLSFLRILFSLKYIGEKNFSILERELKILASLLAKEAEKARFAFPEELLFDSEDQSIDRHEAGLEFSELPEEDSEADKHKDIKDIKDTVSTPGVETGELIRGFDSGSRKRSRKSSVDPDQRKSAILKLLKDKKKACSSGAERFCGVTVNDIVKVIPGCSKKTIQRDLKDMIADNVVKKEGDKRWSTYILA